MRPSRELDNLTAGSKRNAFPIPASCIFMNIYSRICRQPGIVDTYNVQLNRGLVRCIWRGKQGNVLLWARHIGRMVWYSHDMGMRSPLTKSYVTGPREN